MRYVKSIKGNFVEVLNTDTWTSTFYDEERAVSAAKEKHIYGVRDGIIDVFDMKRYVQIVEAREKIFNLTGIETNYGLDDCGRLQLIVWGHLDDYSSGKGDVLNVADGTYMLGDGRYPCDNCLKPYELRLPKSCREIAEERVSYGPIRGGNFNYITLVGRWAFQGCNNLRILNFDSVIEVGKEAFAKCLNVESVFMPKAERIDSFAFKGCTSLREANISSLSSTWLESGESHDIFAECPNLKKLIVSDEVAGNITKYQEQLGIGELLKSNSDLEILAISSKG